MVLDTSAIAAIFLREPEGEEFTSAIEADPRRLISAATLVECSLVLEGRAADAGGRELDLFLHRTQTGVVSVDAEQAEAARSAWRRFGRGRHSAALNFGDCFSYALAQVSGEPLLFKGADFARTDVVPALSSS
ncbi:MAG: type II toxin-antitoxin system VapC family toxin [Actinomycetota bacterium]|nr:type II toxin-antitoxin system VapC family toxin [Actinomycetota bacterium]